MIKTHVRGIFDTDLHEVSWHFATHEVVRPSGFLVLLTEWRSVSKTPYKMGFCFYPTLKQQIQPINPLKNVSKVDDPSSTITRTARCFDVLSQVRTIWHCVIGQERELLWPDWLNWWVCPWVPAFEIQFFFTPKNPGTHGQVWGYHCFIYWSLFDRTCSKYCRKNVNHFEFKFGWWT